MSLTVNRVIDGDLSPLSNIDGDIMSISDIDGNITYGNGFGVRDYEKLINKPQIESVTLIGDKSFEELGLYGLDTSEILSILV